MPQSDVLDADSRPRQHVFREIFRTNAWRGRESVSGHGSSLATTEELRRSLPAILKRLNVHSVLDLPCGDHLWMPEVLRRAGNIDYTGADIVSELVQSNMGKYGNANTRFVVLDVCNSSLPRADLLLCRDCLVHLPLQDISSALHNIASSDILYFASTTFPLHGQSGDIKTGEWRPLNLEHAPFFLPKPVICLNEKLDNGQSPYSDKSLAIWRVDDLRISLGLQPRGSRPLANNFALPTERDLMVLPGALHVDEFRTLARGPAAMDREELSRHWDRQWKSVKSEMRRREKEERDLVDRPRIAALPEAWESHAQRFAHSRKVQSNFAGAAIAMATVRLDRLVATQTFLQVAKLRSTCLELHKNLSGKKSLIDVCLPLRRSGSQTKANGATLDEPGEWRLIESTPLDPEAGRTQNTESSRQVRLTSTLVRPTGALQALRYGERIYLTGGHYLGLSLLAYGYTRAPCLIQVCATPSEFIKASNLTLARKGMELANSIRPPLLKDYLDLKLLARIPSAQGQLRPAVALSIG